MQTTKEKGDLLEDIVAEFCNDIHKARVSKNIKIIGMDSKTERQIDVLIEGRYDIFDVRIVIESKNHASPIGVEIIESFKTKLRDIKGDLGIIVCPVGFTTGAVQLAEANNIQLYKAYDKRIDNSNLFIPIRYIEPDISSFQFSFSHRVIGQFSMPSDISKWLFHVNSKRLNADQLIMYAWNTGMIPHKAGEHVANFNATTVSDIENPAKVQYCEVSINIIVIEKYFLKLFPASFLKNIKNNDKKFNLKIDMYSKEEDMINNGWKKFETFEELNKAANIENQPAEVRALIVRPGYTYNI